jgi:serine/threonine-protein kinase
MNTGVRPPEVAVAGVARTSATLPTELVHQASARLGLVSLLYAATYSSTFFSGHVMYMMGREIPIFPGNVEHVAASVSIAASLAVFLMTRFWRIDPATVLDFGLLYEVVASLGIVVAEFWNVGFSGHMAMAAGGEKPWFGISWVCVWILMFPTVVPNTPGKTALASFASASMAPLALLLSMALGQTRDVPAPVWIGMMIGVYGSATLAWITSRYIYGLGRDIKAAREMGSYRLVELLGRGGMGEVWRAEHRMLARPAAIKLIRRESLQLDRESTGVRRRFEREAAATAMLRSPHTVELYDFGITDDGLFYYAMELLDGLDLDSFVTRFGAVPPPRAVSWLLQACDSLSEAHQRGLVHRDIKPANIYVCRLGTAVDWIKVLDFGLVKQAPSGAQASRLTVDGVAAGTPGYMAPEMAEGMSNVDHRADIYALGCVGYWLLTGTLVFEGASAVKMIVEHARTPPVPPSARSELVIPAALDEVILSCLAKSPDERPQSALELADRLRSLPVGGSWSAVDARSWWDLHLPVSASPAAGSVAPPSAAPTA